MTSHRDILGGDVSDIVSDAQMVATVGHSFISHPRIAAGPRDPNPPDEWIEKQQLVDSDMGAVYVEAKETPGSNESNTLRAVKRIHFTGSPEEQKQIRRELVNVFKYSYPSLKDYFIQPSGWFFNDSYVHITMEYYEFGDLATYIMDTSKCSQNRLTEDDAGCIASQVIDGLSALHAHDVAHGDLKPSNIIIKQQPPQLWQVKVGNFGLSERAESNDDIPLVDGPVEFMAPEIQGFPAKDDNDENTEDNPAAIDMWCYGQTIYWLLTGEFMFPTEEQRSEFFNDKGEFPDSTLLNYGITSRAIQLLTRLTKVNPAERLTAAATLVQPWVMKHAEKRDSSADAASLAGLQDEHNDEALTGLSLGYPTSAPSSYSSVDQPTTSSTSAHGSPFSDATPTGMPKPSQGTGGVDGVMVWDQSDQSSGPDAASSSRSSSSNQNQASAQRGSTVGTVQPQVDTNHPPSTRADRPAPINTNIRRTLVPVPGDLEPLPPSVTGPMNTSQPQDNASTTGRPQIQDDMIRELLEQARVYEMQRDYPRAEETRLRILQHKELTLGNTNLRTINARQALADLLSLQETRLQEAEALYCQTIQYQRAAFGDRDPRTLETMQKLVRILFAQDKHELAERVGRDLFSARRATLGMGDPSTVHCLEFLARALALQERFDEAEPLARQVWMFGNRWMGPDHPETIYSLCALSEILCGQAKYDEAEAVLKDGLLIVTGRSDESTNAILERLHRVASRLQSQEEHDEAVRILGEVHDIRSSTLGPEAPLTLETTLDMARSYSAMDGRRADAIGLFQMLLVSQIKVLGRDHQSTIVAMCSLADAYEADGDFEQAAAIYWQLLEAKARTRGKEHPRTLEIMHFLAKALSEQTDEYELDDAEIAYRRAFRLQRKVLGENDPDTLVTQHDLGCFLFRRNEIKESEYLLRSTLKKQLETLGEQNYSTIDTMNALVELYDKQGDRAKAAIMARRVVDIQKVFMGPNDIDTIESMNTLANILKHDNPAEALPLFQEVLHLRSQTLSDEDPDTIKSMYDVGTMLKNRGDIEDSTTILKEAVRLGKKSLGKNHVHTLGAMNSLADAFSKMSQHDEAGLVYQEMMRTTHVQE